MVASIPILANATDVTGERSDESEGAAVNTLHITFEGQNINGTGGALLNKLEIHFKMTSYKNTRSVCSQFFERIK